MIIATTPAVCPRPGSFMVEKTNVDKILTVCLTIPWIWFFCLTLAPAFGDNGKAKQNSLPVSSMLV